MKFNYNSRTNITRQLKTGDIVIIKKEFLQEAMHMAGLVYYENSGKDVTVVTARGTDLGLFSLIDSKKYLQYICHIDLSLNVCNNMVFGFENFDSVFRKHIHPIFMSEEVILAYNAGLKKINARTIKIIKNNLNT